jgi:putative peptide zinc metalloprotease protein
MMSATNTWWGCCRDYKRRLIVDRHVRLRTDLEFREESEGLHAPVILKDPVTRRFYRFAPVQGSVLRRLDGSQDLESVARAVSELHQVPVEVHQVCEFVEKLQHLLLLDTPASWSRLDALRKRPKRFWGTVLSIKVHAFNPDALLTRLEHRLRFCFGPVFTVLVWTALAGATAISIVHWDSLYFSLGTLVSLYSLPLVFLAAFLIMTVHEFAHGLTLKHFGGRVEEMGFMFLYFIPGLYCNVSDAWMLNKRQRLYTTLAGGYIQFFLWAAATLIWRIFAPETIASRFCLAAIGFSAVQAVFNFNPLIKLDGYYVLSDLLEVPNLRAKALAHLKKALRGLVMGQRGGPQSHARERRIFVVYGVLSLTFSTALLVIVAGKIVGWFVREYQGWGLVATGLLCMALLPFGAKSKDVSGQTGVKTSPNLRKPRLAALVLAVAAVITVLLPWELKVSGEFNILPETQVIINPQIEGTLKTIYVDEGDRVRTGSVLAEVQNLDLSNSYEETKGELHAQSAVLDLLKAGTRPEEIETARRLVATKDTELSNTVRVEEQRRLLSETISKKQSELDNAGRNYDRSRRLASDGLIARSELDRDRTLYEVQVKELSEAQAQLKVLDEKTSRDREVKERELDQARSQLNVLLAGSRKESVAAVVAQVNKLKDKLSILEQQLAYMQIRSPIDGIVATPRLRNRIGEYLSRGLLFCTIVSEGRVIVDMPVPEKEIADIRPGFPITMKVRGFPRLSFEARVATIAPVATESGGMRFVSIRGELDNKDGLLKSGMTGVGKILCGKRMIFKLLTRRAVRWLRTEFWEYLP